MSTPANKRRRIVYSCEQCRARKLKCDRQRPSCNNCLKHSNLCEYASHNGSNDKDVIDAQIKALKNQIQQLEARKSESGPVKPVGFINFSQIFSLPSMIKKNKDIDSILETSEIGKSIPLFIEEYLSKEKDKYSNLDLLKFNIRQQGNGVYEVIKPYLTDIKKVKKSTQKFFETELYSTFAYMHKTNFYKQFDLFFALKKEKLSTNDYIFLGQLLLIMRIVFISLYNCGYDQEDELFFVGVEAFNLANICLEEARFPLYFQNIETMRLMLLISDCENYSPEAIGLHFGLRQGSAQYLIRAGVALKYNIDEIDSEQSNSIRIIWHQILDVERTDLIYNGSSMFTDFDTYTTLLPILNENDKDSFEYVTIKRFHDRSNNFKDIVFELSKMITNAKNPATLNDYQKILDHLIEKCNGVGLESILKLESNTREQKSVKGFKFLDFLDLHCLTFMLASHIFLYYDGKPDSPRKIQSIENVIKIANSMITLSYFIDPHQQHYYNLKEHFGYNIQLIPKILQNLHRLVQLQYTLLIKCCYQNSINSNFKLNEIKRITYQNIKVIISSFGKISNRYLYAKRLYMVQSYFTLKFFGLNCDISEIYLNDLKNRGDPLLTENDYDVILKNLIELSGDRNLSENLYEEPLAKYFESLISDSNAKLNKPFSLERIDEFLNTQSFLT